MADPYTFTTDEERRPPALTLMTAIGILFALFVLWKVADIIDDAPGRLAEITAQDKDTVRYDHVARFADDGTLYSTSVRDVAVRANRTTGYAIVPAELEPKQERLDANFTWGATAAERLEGTFVGQTVRMELPPEEVPFGFTPFPDADGIVRIYFEFPVREPVTLTQGQDLGGETFDLDSFLAEQSEAIGHPIEDGERVDIGFSIVPYHIVFDIDRDAGTVTIRTDIKDGAAYPIPGMDAAATTLVEGDVVRYRLDAEEGSTFTFQPEDATYQELRGTWRNVHREDIWRPGTYIVREVTEETVRLGYSPETDAARVGRPLVLELTLLSIGDTQEATA